MAWWRARTSPAAENANKARLLLRVPADAVVRLNGQRMRANGEEREYLSPELEEGETYVYDIQVTWTQEGQKREESRQVKVVANRTTSVPPYAMTRIPQYWMKTIGM